MDAVAAAVAAEAAIESTEPEPPTTTAPQGGASAAAAASAMDKDNDNNGSAGQEQGQGPGPQPPHAVVREAQAYLERLAMSCENRAVPTEGERAEHAPSGGWAGPMTAAEISRLYRELLRLREDGGPGIAAVDPELLLAVVPYLQAHVRMGAELSLVREAGKALAADPGADLAEWMTYRGEGSTLLLKTIMAIEAATASLVIITADGIDRRLVQQELMDECVALLKHQVQQHLLPAFDPHSATLPRPAAQAARDAAAYSESEAEGSEGMDEDEDDDDDMSDGGGSRSSRGSAKAGKGKGKGKKAPAKKRKGAKGGKGGKKGGGAGVGDDSGWEPYRPVLAQLPRAAGKVRELLDQCEALVGAVKLDDPLLLALAPACLATLRPDVSGAGGGDALLKLQPVQLSALGLLQAIFGRYPQHRALLLEDVLALLPKLPQGKRGLRTFRLHYRALTLGSEGQNVQMVTALVLLLLQSAVTRPRRLLRSLAGGGDAAAEEGGSGKRANGDADADDDEDGVFAFPASGKDGGRPQLEGEEAVLHWAQAFASVFLERCGRKNGGAEYRVLLGQMVEDLQLALLLPEWPAAELLLQAICVLLLRDLYQHTQGQGKAEEPGYYLQGLDLLGKVLSRLRDMGRECGDAAAFLSRALGQELRKAVEEGASLGDGEEGGRLVLDWFRRVMAGRMAALGLKRRAAAGGVGGALAGREEEEEEASAASGASSKGSRGGKGARGGKGKGARGGKGGAARGGGAAGRKRKRGGAANGGGGAAETSGEESEVSASDASTGSRGGKGRGRGRKRGSGAAVAGGGRRKGKGGGAGAASASEGEDSDGQAAAGASPESSLPPPPEDAEALMAWVTDADVARQLVLNYLSHRAQKGEPWLRRARGCALARWVAEEAAGGGGEADGGDGDSGSSPKRRLQRERDARKPPLYWAFLEAQWAAPDRSALQAEDLHHALPTESVVRLAHGLAQARPLLQSFDKLLLRLLALLGQGAAAWRARVMKAVGGILEADASLMALPPVRQAVLDRLRDEATSVRQATVDLVGKYVLQPGQPTALFEGYYPALAERLLDRGVSVRKSVVRLLAEYLARRPDHALRTEICRRLVERAGVVKEEDTVKDLIRDSFQVMWFSPPQARAAEPEPEPEPAGPPTPGGEAGAESEGEEAAAAAAGGVGATVAPLSDKAHLAAVGLQMVEVIAGLSHTDWLVALLTGLLFGPGDGEQGKKDRVKQRKQVGKRCQAIVDALVQALLALDEGSAPPLDTRLPDLASPEKQLLGVVATLHVFARASPLLLVAHVDTLLPYLKGENHLEPAEEAALCALVAQMVTLVVPHLSHPDRRVFSQVTQDLVRVTYRFGAAAIHAAVDCLGCVARHVLARDGGGEAAAAAPVLALANTFYAVLKRFKEERGFAGPDRTKRSSVHRALVVLGCVCRYGPGLKPPPGASEGALPRARMQQPLAEELTRGNAYEMCYRLLGLYLGKDPETETKAVQALCALFTGCMQLMLTAQRDGVIGRMLGAGRGRADDEEGDGEGQRNQVRLQALRSLREVLVAEETRVESGAARARMAESGVTLKERVKGDQDAEASIVGGVIQEQLPAIQRLLFHRDAATRLAAVALLSVLHRQGLVNPLQTLPALIALQADPAPAVRGQAYRQLLLEHEKHPEFLPARLLDGVSLAYRFQKQALLAPGQPASALLTVAGAADDRGRTAEARQCIFGPLYASSIRGNRKHRYAFLRGLLSLFEAKAAPTPAAGAHHRTPGGARRGSLGSGAAGNGSSSGNGSTAAGWRDPAFLAFVARVAAALPFDVQEEPLFLVYHVSRLVSLDGSTLLSELRALFARAGLRAAQEGGGEEGGVGGGGGAGDSDSEDSLAPQEPEQGAGEGEGMEVDGEGNGGQQGQLTPALLAEIKAKCAQGMAFGALLHLKFYLKQVYHLSDARCLEYRPNDQTAKTERPLSKPEALPTLHLPTHFLLLSPEGAAAASSSSSSSSSSRPPAPSRKRRRGAAAAAGNGQGEEEEEEEVEEEEEEEEEASLGSGASRRSGGGGGDEENADPQATLRLLARQYGEFRRLMRQSPDDFRLAPVKRRASGGGRGAGRGGRGAGRGRGGRGGGGARGRKVKDYEGESDSDDGGVAGSSSEEV